MNSIKVMLLAAAGLITLATTAQAQSNSFAGAMIDDKQIIFQQTVDLNTVVEVANEIGITQTGFVTQGGEQVAVLKNAKGGTYLVKTFGCREGRCAGLNFFVLFSAQTLNPGVSNLNQFNLKRPQGNVAYIPEINGYVVHRVSASFGGITRGSLKGEIGFFMGYTSAFVEWAVQQNKTVEVSAGEGARSDGKIDNNLQGVPQSEFVADIQGVINALKEAGYTEEDYTYQW